MPQANPTGAHISPEEDQARLDLFTKHNFNISETARKIGISRTSFQKVVKRWIRDDRIPENAARSANDYAVAEVLSARERKARAYEAKKRKGDWRKLVVRKMPSKPFILKILGDPHLDADGTDYKLFERHFCEMDPDRDTYGICVGDWFNNWKGALAGLYADDTVKPSDAWMLLCDVMAEHGRGLIAACSGNHDDWAHGPVDPVADLMRRHGVTYRKGAVRLGLFFEDLDRTITVAIRHKWRGHSMYSPAHAINRAARGGWRDHISAGGHIHQDEPRMYCHPDGFVQHLCQVSAFKEFDDYPDVHGFMPHRISPAWDLVIDPRRADTDPDLVKVFWDTEAARKYLEAL